MTKKSHEINIQLQIVLEIVLFYRLEDYIAQIKLLIGRDIFTELLHIQNENLNNTVFNKLNII